MPLNPAKAFVIVRDRLCQCQKCSSEVSSETCYDSADFEQKTSETPHSVGRSEEYRREDRERPEGASGLGRGKRERNPQEPLKKPCKRPIKGRLNRVRELIQRLGNGFVVDTFDIAKHYCEARIHVVLSFDVPIIGCDCYLILQGPPPKTIKRQSYSGRAGNRDSNRGRAQLQDVPILIEVGCKMQGIEIRVPPRYGFRSLRKLSHSAPPMLSIARRRSAQKYSFRSSEIVKATFLGLRHFPPAAR